MPNPYPATVIQPLGDYVVVLRDDPVSPDTKVFIPESAKEVPNTGIVLAVGPGLPLPYPGITTTISSDRVLQEPARHPVSVAVGDRVMFNAYTYTEIKDPQTQMQLFLIRDKNLIATIPHTPTPNPEAPSHE